MYSIQDELENAGGGGGGGGGKKKERQGAKTLEASQAQARENSIENTEEKAIKHPEKSAELNTEIEAVITRMLNRDEKETGLANLEQYLLWVRDVVENKHEERTVEGESVIDEYRKGAGAGGQNVNKVSTSIRMMHTPTGFKLKESKQRTQVQNKEIAIERMRELVSDHIDKWMDLVTSTEVPPRKVVWDKLNTLIGSRIDSDKQVNGKKLSDNKIEAFRKIKRLFVDEKYVSEI